MTGFGATDEHSLMLRAHCQTSGVSLSQQDPMNDIARAADEALPAAGRDILRLIRRVRAEAA